MEAAGSANDLNGVRTLAGEHFVLRTRYFDDQLLSSAQPQVVILAAGQRNRRLDISGRYAGAAPEVPSLFGGLRSAD